MIIAVSLHQDIFDLSPDATGVGSIREKGESSFGLVLQFVSLDKTHLDTAEGLSLTTSAEITGNKVLDPDVEEIVKTITDGVFIELVPPSPWVSSPNGPLVRPGSQTAADTNTDDLHVLPLK